MCIIVGTSAGRAQGHRAERNYKTPNEHCSFAQGDRGTRAHKRVVKVKDTRRSYLGGWPSGTHSDTASPIGTPWLITCSRFGRPGLASVER
jgi:hypothetical protein